MRGSTSYGPTPGTGPAVGPWPVTPTTITGQGPHPCTSLSPASRAARSPFVLRGPPTRPTGLHPLARWAGRLSAVSCDDRPGLHARLVASDPGGDAAARHPGCGARPDHDLEAAGVPRPAAEEPIILDAPGGGRRRKKASAILLRRTKQGVAEWYIVEMLEKSWDGIEVHTIQGWNVGKPPYGYLAERHKHPVPAKRAEGKYKTKLAIDERRGPVVTTIYSWRVNEKLSYRAIAERLNTDLDRYPPPQPVDPERAVGRWTGSAVREILCNPKYTGHMAWNRRSTKHKLPPARPTPSTNG